MWACDDFPFIWEKNNITFADSPSTLNLANMRRPPQSTPPLMYQDIKDSPPSSPSEYSEMPYLRYNVRP